MKFESRTCQLAEIFLITLLLSVFSFFIHFRFPLRWISFLSLMMAAFIIARYISFSLSFHFFEKKFYFSKQMGKACIIGFLLGVLLAYMYRYYYVIHYIPKSFQSFVCLAALIGIGEEIIFRGFILGHLSRFSPWVSVPVASFSHSVYKCCIFLIPINGHSINIPMLFIWTFIGGLFFGWLKLYGRSIIPPAIAHGVFDIVAYAEYVKAPWWVW